jgi:CRP-like cAMP-binding protein
MLEYVPLLRGIQFLKGLDDEALASLAALVRREAFAVGTTIVKQGVVGTKIFLLLEGRANVVRSMGEMQAPITTLEPTLTFGEMSVIDGEPASASVVADSSVVVLTIERDAFYALLNSSAKLAAQIWRNISLDLCRRIRATTATAQDLYAINRTLAESASFRNFYDLYGP